MITMRKQVRKLRHWKQRFDKNAEFIWRRPTSYANKQYKPGDLIPDELKSNPTKLRRFWESTRIELAEFEDPNVLTGQVDLIKPTDGIVVESGKGSWFIVTDPDGGQHKVNGQRKLEKFLEKLKAEKAEMGDDFLQ
jgi:hypothetical protein